MALISTQPTKYLGGIWPSTVVRNSIDPWISTIFPLYAAFLTDSPTCMRLRSGTHSSKLTNARSHQFPSSIYSDYVAGYAHVRRMNTWSVYSLDPDKILSRHPTEEAHNPEARHVTGGFQLGSEQVRHRYQCERHIAADPWYKANRRNYG